MVVTDPIADLLTRIRNALTAKHETVSVPTSKMKKAIADILVNEGYIKSAEVQENEGKSEILITLKYGPKNEKVITSLKRISKPGLRVYCGYEQLPKVLGGLGIAIISTSKGVMTDKVARANKIGGEVLAYVW
jgi:small subunit ribosomal protein S8